MNIIFPSIPLKHTRGKIEKHFKRSNTMHTFHLKDFINEHRLYEHLKKLHLKILNGFHGLLVKLHGLLENFQMKSVEESFRGDAFSDTAALTILFIMILFIIKTCLTIYRNSIMFL